MIHIRRNGARLENGLSVYPLTDKFYSGFIVRYGKKIPLTTLGSKVFAFRYNKVRKLWVIRNFDMW